jgi:hypothetical protein
MEGERRRELSYQIEMGVGVRRVLIRLGKQGTIEVKGIDV